MRKYDDSDDCVTPEECYVGLMIIAAFAFVLPVISVIMQIMNIIHQ